MEEEIKLSEEVNDIDEVEEMDEMVVEDSDASDAEDLVVEGENQRSWLREWWGRRLTYIICNVNQLVYIFYTLWSVEISTSKDYRVYGADNMTFNLSTVTPSLDIEIFCGKNNSSSMASDPSS